MNHRTILMMAMAVSGCASLTHGPKQRVMVSTPGAPKAECTMTSASLPQQHFTTPEAIMIPRSGEAIKITCHKKCFISESKTFSPGINTEDLASNGFFGGAGPLVIDLATKKAYSYDYDFVIQMNSDHRCKAGEKGFLDGNPKDFDNRIQDFSFDATPTPLPETTDKELKDLSSQNVQSKSAPK